MSKIEMMEVNQHTSDEVAKVLADLEAQGIDLAAVGANINAILQKVQNSGGGLQLKSVQRGTIEIDGDSKTGTATISSVDVNKSLVFNLGTRLNSAQSNSAQIGTFGYVLANVSLTDGTTVTANRGRPGISGLSVAFQVVEFA